ncbi:bacteriochlorophyll 4-vinyl reductase [Algihabitans albus]|uniref:bacteriochlorophyll 4-vinyl reductase n=1 Tax=Algihabitans albus TaxID=2164067 RepID=UPI000E5C637F|nr:bacteriochlorophyll 4-vinyl reductase [Algihabitans albus]
MSQTCAKDLPEAAPNPESLLGVAEAGPCCSPLAGRAGARIGPNSLIQVASALEVTVGAERTALLFAGAGLSHRLAVPPQSLVPELEAVRLHGHLRRSLGLRTAQAVAREAGRRTADYLLAHRIPRVAQIALRLLPRRLASHLLVKAIGRNAWTFVGSGVFVGRGGRPARLAVFDGPLCRGVTADSPLCDYYTATFERLFRKLVDADAYGVEIDCQASGAQVCRFEIRF